MLQSVQFGSKLRHHGPGVANCLFCIVIWPFNCSRTTNDMACPEVLTCVFHKKLRVRNSVHDSPSCGVLLFDHLF
jgi:hypothetical protein